MRDIKTIIKMIQADKGKKTGLLADEIGMDRQQLSTWLYRKDGKTLEIVKNIADVLDCDIALVDRTTGEIYK